MEPTAGEPNCAVSIAGREGRHCAVYQDGSVWCWGTAGGVGPKNFEDSARPKRVEGLGLVQSVTLGPRHSCAVDGNAALLCWGDNESGQIDDSGMSPLPPTTPRLPGSEPSPLQGLGLSGTQTCFVNLFAHVYCTGTDAAGVTASLKQIDVGGEPDTTMPGSETHVFDDTGRIFSLDEWGAPQRLDLYGSDNAWLGGGTPSCVLKRSGSLWCTDYQFGAGSRLNVKAALGETVTQAGTGDLFMCALTKQGRVWCEGFNLVGEAATGENTTFADGAFIANLEQVAAISVNQYSACALKQDGSVWCWGAYARDTQTNVPVQVSSCAEQALKPHLPSGRSMTAASAAQRLAEAGQARAQAMCRCGLGEQADESCFSAEDMTPNAVCLAAIAADDGPRLDCLATGLWQDAECFANQACPGNAVLTNCPPELACPPSSANGVEQYCRRLTCALDQEQSLLKSQICNGVVDCTDGSDERNCTANVHSFECDTAGGSITLDRVCDAVPDCDDGSDEQYCP